MIFSSLYRKGFLKGFSFFLVKNQDFIYFMFYALCTLECMANELCMQVEYLRFYVSLRKDDVIRLLSILFITFLEVMFHKTCPEFQI